MGPARRGTASAVALAGLLVAGAPCHGAPATGAVLGLREVAELALRGADPTGPAIADWRTAEERGRLWPSVSLQGRVSSESLDTATTTTQAQFGIGGTIQRYGGDLVVSTNLLQFLETRPRVAAAEAEQRAARLRLTHEQNDRILRAADAFLTLVAERQALAALDSLRREHRDFVQGQEDRLTREAVPMIEVIRARGETLSLDRESLTARHRAATAELVLRKLAGLPPEQPLTLVFADDEIDLSFVDADGLPGLLARVQDGNARLQAARAAVEKARAELQAAESLAYPSLSLHGSVGYGHVSESNGGSFSRTGPRHGVFLTLGIPLFDGGVRRARIAQADLRVKSRQHEAQQAGDEIRAQVEQAFWSFRERQEAVALLARQVELAEEELRQATARTAAGVSPAGEPATVLSKLARLRSELARARGEASVRGIALGLLASRNFFRDASPSSAPRPAPPAPVPEGPGRSPLRHAGAVDYPPPGMSLLPTAGSWPAVTAIAPLGPPSAPGAAPDEGQTPRRAPATSPAAGVDPPDVAPRSAAHAGAAPDVLVRAAAAPPPAPGPAPAGEPASTGAGSRPAARRLTGIEVAEQGAVTTVTLLADGRLARYATFELRQPERFVIDLAGVQPAVALAAAPPPGTRVTRVRTGRQPGALRVVLDLAGRRAGPLRVAERPDGLVITLGWDR